MQAAPPSHSPPDRLYAPGIGLSKALGLFSIGLGLTELMAPKTVSRLTGVKSECLLQFYGARELLCGLGILSSQRPTGWLWGRVAGDVCDLATLSTAMSETQVSGDVRAQRAISAVAGVTLLDLLNASTLSAAAALEG